MPTIRPANGRASRRSDAAKAGSGGAGGAGPESLRRRLVRMWRRRSSRRLIIAGALLTLAAAGSFAAAIDPTLVPRLRAGASAFAASAGFGLNAIDAAGARHTSDRDILAAVSDGTEHSVFDVDLAAARNRVMWEPWVADAEVRRMLPDAILVRVTEYEAAARWRRADGRMVLIDAEGVDFPAPGAEGFTRLPLVVGAGAGRAAPALFRELASRPALRARVQYMQRIGERRWNLAFRNGIIVKLPESDVARALRDLDFLEERDVLDRDILEIDLRIPGRSFILPRDPAVLSRLRERAGG